MTEEEAMDAVRFWGDLPVENTYSDSPVEVNDLWSKCYEDFTEELSEILEEDGYDLYKLLDQVITKEKRGK